MTSKIEKILAFSFNRINKTHDFCSGSFQKSSPSMLRLHWRLYIPQEECYLLLLLFFFPQIFSSWKQIIQMRKAENKETRQERQPTQTQGSTLTTLWRSSMNHFHPIETTDSVLRVYARRSNHLWLSLIWSEVEPYSSGVHESVRLMMTSTSIEPVGCWCYLHSNDDDDSSKGQRHDRQRGYPDYIMDNDDD